MGRSEVMQEEEDIEIAKLEELLEPLKRSVRELCRALRWASLSEEEANAWLDTLTRGRERLRAVIGRLEGILIADDDAILAAEIIGEELILNGGNQVQMFTRKAEAPMNQELLREQAYIESLKTETHSRIAALSGKREKEVVKFLEGLDWRALRRDRENAIRQFFVPAEPSFIPVRMMHPDNDEDFQAAKQYFSELKEAANETKARGDEVIVLINQLRVETGRFNGLVSTHKNRIELARKRLERIIAQGAEVA